MNKNTSNESPGNVKRKRRGLWWKIPLGLLLILVVLLAIVWVKLPSIATSIVNAKLPGILQTDASLERIELQLGQGFAAIHGLRIGQPDGFGDTALLELKRVTARVNVGSLTGGELIVIEAVELDGLTANLIKDESGVLNVTRLGPPPSPEEEATAEPSDDTPKESKPLSIALENLKVSDVAVTYTDQSTDAVPSSVDLGDFGVLLENCEVQLGESTEVNAQKLEFTLRDIAVSLPGKIGLGLLGVQLDGCQVKIGEDVAVTMNQGGVTLEEIKIAQPDGFGDDALLEVPRIHLDIGSKPFVDNIVSLNRLDIEGLRTHLVRDTNGVLSATRLTPTSEPETSAPSEVADTPDTSDDPEAGAPVGVYLAALGLTDFSIAYTDAKLGDEVPIEINIKDLNIAGENIMAFLENPPVETSSMNLDFLIDQGDNPPAAFGLRANVGQVGAGVPNVNAQAKLTGLLLDTLGTLVPNTARRAVGGEGLDGRFSVALNATSIDLHGKASTDKKHEYPFSVHGPIEKPKVDLGPILLGVASRFSTGLAMNLAGSATDAAMKMAGGVAGEAKDLGKGAAKTVGKVGGGLFGAAKAAFTGDLEDVGDGLKDATAGAAKEAGSGIKEAGGGMKDMTKDTAKAAGGGEKTAKWLNQSSERHLEAMSAAEQALSEMPYPPPTLEVPPPE